MLQLIAIKTKSNIYLSDDLNGTNYGNTILHNYLFDSIQPKSTFNPKWIELCCIPTTIKKVVPSSKIRTHWELMDEYTPSNNLPKTINVSYNITDDIDQEDYDEEDKFKVRSSYQKISGLYKPVYKETEPTVEEILFEIAIIEEFEDEFSFTKKPFTPKYNFLDQLNTHPAILETKPCKLTSVESYKIIREHVLKNINPKVAKISSNFDFCFTVEKVIELCEPEAYQVNVNAMTKKKDKYETRYRNTRQLVIFKTAPNIPRKGVYNGYENYSTKEFSGSNYEDMMNNIDIYLTELMNIINQPLSDCPHCKGYGVIFK